MERQEPPRVEGEPGHTDTGAGADQRGAGGGGSRRVLRLWLVPALLVGGLLLWLIVERIWICDDAAITVRSVDNLVHGHGLRWNVVERVQSFTHPLWALVLIPLLGAGLPWFMALPALGVVLSLVVIVVLSALARDARAACMGLAALAGSTAFIDYSTSGLENPLTNVLLVLLPAAVPVAVPTARDLRRVALVVAALALTRQDLLLFGAPLALYAAARSIRRGSVGLGGASRALAIGLSPLVAWELFSLVYYGVPFPNTAYAKLNTGIVRIDSLKLGLDYFCYTLAEDPWTLCAAVGLGALSAHWRTSPVALCVAASSAVYLAYVAWIGGDFMGGRFFVAPLVASAAVFTSRHVRPPERSELGALATLAVVLAVCKQAPFRQVLGQPDASAFDERAANVASTGLEALRRAGGDGPNNVWMRRGASWRKKAALARPGPDGRVTFIQHAHAVGMLAVAAGPGVHIVDHLGLTDPLIARLPAAYDPKVRVGHFERMGQWSAKVSVTRRCPLEHETCRFWRDYTATLATGQCTLEDPRLCEYWAALESVTRGPLFTLERWRNIFRLNTGQLDGLIDRDRYREAARAYPGSEG